MNAIVDTADASDEIDYRPTPAQRAHRRSVLFLRWLRKIHLYVGLWGAALGFLFGATGILMNHRAVLQIPIEKSVQKTAQLPLPDDGTRVFDSADDMAAWLRTELKFDAQHTRVKADPPRKVTWGDKQLQQPARWSFNFNSPHKSISAEYFAGNRFVKVETNDATPIGTLMRLHTASGASAFWVLLADTIAGALVVLSITGLLLWSRLHPLRLTAAVTSLGALTLAAVYMWTAV